MRYALLILGFVVLGFTAIASESKYPRNIAQWQEQTIPPEADIAGRRVWFYAANYSNDEWDVFTEGGEICARLITTKFPMQRERPKFVPDAGGYFIGHTNLGFFNYTTARVDDDWLVGFDNGEFGAAIYCFSTDGKRKYKVSDHQVQDFFSLSNGLYAIEGLAHMGSSSGSIIRFTRSDPKTHWEAHTSVKLPFAPEAIAVRRDGSMVIKLSESLVSIGADKKIHTITSGPPLNHFGAHSILLSSDETKLYIGMRQYVGELDLPSGKLRFLIPSDKFLNKLPKEDEERIRK